MPVYHHTELQQTKSQIKGFIMTQSVFLQIVSFQCNFGVFWFGVVGVFFVTKIVTSLVLYTILPLKVLIQCGSVQSRTKTGNELILVLFLAQLATTSTVWPSELHARFFLDVSALGLGS